MNARRVEVTFSEGDWAALNEARGFESRASFVKRHYLRALRQEPPPDLVPPVVHPNGFVERHRDWRPRHEREADEPTSEKELQGLKNIAEDATPSPAAAKRTLPPSVKSGRDVLNAQRQERMNKQRKP